MAYIYKITNQINGKQYVGKTMLTIEKRWQEHCKDSKRRKIEKRPLYSAMRKYGIENFKIEEIEECSDVIVNEREIYWIEKLQTFKNGYNVTIGGDGKHYLDYDLICETYLEVKNLKETAKICGCCTDSVSNILKERGIQVVPTKEIMRKRLSKPIKQYDLDKNYIQTFASVRDAGKYIQSLDPEKRKNLSGICEHISGVAKGKRKTAYKYIWKYD